MEDFNKKWFKVLRIIRLIIYIILFLTFIIIPTSYFIDNPSNCIFRSKYNIVCPTCGVTRSFSAIMHFNFKQAFIYNPVFTIAMGPIFIFLFIQDLINIVISFINKRKKYSIIEYIIFKYL